MLHGVADPDFIARLKGNVLVTTMVIYYNPDFRHVLQEFIFQQLDELPSYPRLNSFLTHWEKHIEGPIHSVFFSHVGLLTPAEVKMFDSGFVIN